MKLNYTYNLMRDLREGEWVENYMGDLERQNQKLKQQIKDQQELIESAHNLISKYAWLLLPITNPTEFNEAKEFEEKLTTYKNKYQ